MDDCCSSSNQCNAPTCPNDGARTKGVGSITLDSLLSEEARAELTAQKYFFCSSPNCDVVYVSANGEHVITKDQINVRVGVKETSAPIPLCYCFGHTRENVVDDIRANGDTDIQRSVTSRVKAGDCRCEETNPSGGCCLGDISRAIKTARVEVKREGASASADE